MERLAQGNSVLLIAEADGLALGFSQLYPSFSSVSMAPIFILNDLFVRPEAIRLTLSTAHTNTAAQALYASAGWERDEMFSVYHYGLSR